MSAVRRRLNFRMAPVANHAQLAFGAVVPLCSQSGRLMSLARNSSTVSTQAVTALEDGDPAKKGNRTEKAASI